jgi:hypothetical protein
MDKMHIVLFSLVFGLGLVFFAGCAARKTPIYPSLMEIPPVPNYTSIKKQWNTDAVCWVGMTEDAKWEWNFPATSSQEILCVRKHTPAIIQQLIREELREAGYDVKVYHNEYLTRKKRLALNKLVFFTGFEIKKILVKEGSCFDMKLTLISMNNPDMEQRAKYEVWGRCVLASEETKPWKEVMRTCVANILMVPEFRQTLEKVETQ